MRPSSKASDMEKLLDAVAAVVHLISPEKVQAIASRVRRTEASKAASALAGVVGTPAASEVVDRLAEAWRATNVGADELASMLLAASHIFANLLPSNPSNSSGPDRRRRSFRHAERSERF